MTLANITIIAQGYVAETKDGLLQIAESSNWKITEKTNEKGELTIMCDEPEGSWMFFIDNEQFIYKSYFFPETRKIYDFHISTLGEQYEAISRAEWRNYYQWGEIIIEIGITEHVTDRPFLVFNAMYY